jgi:hypothetical protein
MVPRTLTKRGSSKGKAKMPADLEKMFAAAESGKALPRPKAQTELAREVAGSISARQRNYGVEWAERLAGDLSTATD